MDTKRIALIIPNTDTTLESDLQRELPSNYIIHTQRILLEEVSKEAEKRMVDVELPNSLAYLKGITEYSAAVFGCTSASAVYGVEGLHYIRNYLEENFNCKSITAFEAVINQIREKKGKRISLISPYTKEVNQFMIDSLAENGIKVTYSNGLGILDDTEIGKVKPSQILSFIRDEKDNIVSNSDLCLVSCTNFRAVEAREEIMEILGMDLVTSNHSILEFLLKI